jgi:hypothetical protein
MRRCFHPLSLKLRLVLESAYVIFSGKYRLCCINPTGDSLFESSMIAGGYEPLGPYKVQDHELVCLQ